MKLYLHHVFIGLSQLVNTLFGGWPDETLSSHLYRLDNDRKLFGEILRPVVDYIAFILFKEQKHCYLSFLSEVAHNQQSPSNKTTDK